MAWNFKLLPSDSLESSLRWQGVILWLCSAALALLASWTWPLWWVWLSTLLGTLWLNRQQQLQAKRQLAAFNRASVQLEALHNQDYSLQARAAYRRGIAADFQQQLHQLSQQLQQRKSFFDEQQFLLYRLIDQLNTPILVFDHKQQLSYANNEFTILFGQPWQSMRHASASLLGLQPEPNWHFVDAVRQRQWQIRHSRFLEQGQRQQLLVFINIQTALRETELRAWQQLIRVLSHEIRNSLTPVLALSEHLQQKLPAGREQQALQVIRERSRHLQDFVSRYSELNKPLTINLQRIHSDQLCHALQLLFDGQLNTGCDTAITFISDMTLLQQVLINLLKNAFEAGSPPGSVEIRFRQQSQVLIEVQDQGQGLLAPQNLFVPFYSTKPQGQGIGLVLCRQIIEQLGGSLSLANRTDHSPGVCAQIILPSTASSVNEAGYNSLLPNGTD